MRELIGILVVLGALTTYYYGGGKNKEQIQDMAQQEASAYIQEYGGPVSAAKTVAFVKGQPNPLLGDKPLAVFLTKEKIVLYNPGPKRNVPRSIPIALRSVRSMKFYGNKLYVNGNDRSQIEMLIDNSIYARYFKDRLRELTGK